MAAKLLHGGEKLVWEDTSYMGIGKRLEHSGPDADFMIARHWDKVRRLAGHTNLMLSRKCLIMYRSLRMHFGKDCSFWRSNTVELHVVVKGSDSFSLFCRVLALFRGSQNPSFGGISSHV